MNKQPPQTPAQQLCAVVDANINSPMVRATALGKVLPLVRQWVLIVEEDIAAARDRDIVLARILLKRHYGQKTMTAEEHAALTAIAGAEDVEGNRGS